MPRYAPNSALTIDLMPIGQSREPLMRIDDFLAEPKALMNSAARSPDWADLPPGGYPGRRAPLPGDYVRRTLRRLDAPIRKAFFDRPMKLDRFECSFSLVTRQPTELTPLQRVPHIDIARPGRVAILHYLCDAAFGGTAFFRQDITGLEQIGPHTRDRYIAARTEDLNALGPGHLYPGVGTPGYTRTGYVEARFNRLVAYRSFTLHSGIVEDAERLTGDPRTGRLTANFFVDYVPAEG